jgi:hypothetical protein
VKKKDVWDKRLHNFGKTSVKWCKLEPNQKEKTNCKRLTLNVLKSCFGAIRTSSLDVSEK